MMVAICPPDVGVTVLSCGANPGADARRVISTLGMPEHNGPARKRHDEPIRDSAAPVKGKSGPPHKDCSK
jgi:hypothetical protein